MMNEREKYPSASQESSQRMSEIAKHSTNYQDRTEKFPEKVLGDQAQGVKPADDIHQEAAREPQICLNQYEYAARYQQV